MKVRNLARPMFAAFALAAVACVPVASAADGEQLQSAPAGTPQATRPGPGYPMGPGMMRGYGGYGSSGPAYRNDDETSGRPYGPGGAWGHRGYGPGMMWGYGGDGPGMMGGYQGYGPGMMGGYGYGGYGGYGPGMMGGYGGGMMGAGCGWVIGAIGLNSDQVSKIEHVCDDTLKKQWELAGRLIDEHQRLRDMMLADRRDPKALGQEFAKAQAIQRQMFELSVDAGNRVEALLTPQQRQQYQEMRHWGPPHW